MEEATTMAAVGQFKAEITGVGNRMRQHHNGNDPPWRLAMIANARHAARHTSSPRGMNQCSCCTYITGNTWNVIPEKAFLKKRSVRLIKKSNADWAVREDDCPNCRYLRTKKKYWMDFNATRRAATMFPKRESRWKVWRRNLRQWRHLKHLGAEDFNYMEYVCRCFVFIGTGCSITRMASPVALSGYLAFSSSAIQYFVDKYRMFLEVLFTERKRYRKQCGDYYPTIQTSSISTVFLSNLKRGEAVTVRHLDEVWSEAKPYFTKSDEEKRFGRLSAKRLILQFLMVISSTFKLAHEHRIQWW